MSERPDNPLDEQPTTQGGWHSPDEASPWHDPAAQSAQRVTWRSLKALPDHVAPEPSQPGEWHLPDEADTTFAPDDVVEVSDEPRPQPASSIAAQRPEDLIAEILGQKGTAAPRPEDFVYPTRETADEAIEEGVSELVDEADEDMLEIDDEDFSMSEYIALASLAQGDEDDVAGLQADDLSPAEKALYNIARDAADEMDSSRIEPVLEDEATVTLEDTSEEPVSQAQQYAQEQLRALQGDADEPELDFTQQQTTAAPPQEAYTEEQIQLAQQFRETKRQVAVLRQMANQGQIDPNELQVRLQEHTILDPEGNWWMIGYESDGWFRYNNNTGQWEAADPPVPLDAGQPLTETGLGEAAPDVMPGSLPYLPDEGTAPTEYTEQSQYDNTQYSQAQDDYSQQYGVDSPLPYAGQPTVDPNLTQVGASADATQLGYSEPTLDSLGQVDQTVASYPGEQTVPSQAYTDAYDDGYNYDPSIPQAEPSYRDDGYSDYAAQTAPDYEELQRQRRNRLFLIIAGIAFFVLIAGLLTIGGFIWWAQSEYNRIVESWEPQILALGSQEFDFQTATILAADGSVIAELTGEEGARTIVSIEEGDVSPFFIHAIVSSEDPRFYENPGVDPLAIARAFWQNFIAGEVQSGASTITQQIVRERILGSTEVTFDRKLTEALLAIEVANTYSKNQILDIYINEFFYGEQSYGVEAASEFYFDKSAAALNAAEAATLVGILPSPSDSNPVVAPAVAFNNLRVVLNRMIDVNCLQFQHGVWAQTGEPFCINENTLVDDGEGGRVELFRRNSDGTFGGFLAVQIAQVETRRYEPRQSDIIYPHFVYYVLGELDAAYGRAAYIERGFTVQTTLIPRIQNTAESALRQGVDQLGLSGVQTGAAIVIDHRSGSIVSMVGSPDFNNEEIDGQNNNTISLQQPGSAIKPVLYATALTGTQQEGYLTPASILWDVPTQYNIGGTVYQPVNFDGRYRGPVPVRYALAQSLNIPAVKTYAQFGTQNFVNMANGLGINFDPNPDDEFAPSFGLPTALGATEVSLMDLTRAYGVMANDGVRHDLFAVESITERTGSGGERPVELTGNLAREGGVQSISPQVAYLLQNILSDNSARSAPVNGVPSTFPANSPINGQSFGLSSINQVAAKTGTNNTTSGNPSRIWTVGFTNNYSVGIWLGTVNQNTPLTGRITGLTGASPVWNRIMAETINGVNPGSFNTPSGVVQDAVCQLTGTLAPVQSSTCPTRVSEIFIQSQPPPPLDQGFVTEIQIDSWTGLRANQWCPENVVTEVVANVGDPFAVPWLNDTLAGRQILAALNLPANLPAAPANECQQGQPLPTVIMNFPQENTVLEGEVAITGQISAQNLQRWELQISEVGTDNFRAIMQASTQQIPTGGSILLEWDSRGVANGAYILRLAAFATNGGFIFRDVRVTVSNPEPTPVPATSTPFVIQITPLPFEPLPTATPDLFTNP